MINVISRSRLNVVISAFVTVHPHETSAVLHSSSCFFFILSAYFVLLPLRDDGAISLGLSNLPGLFVGSLLLTLIAAPLSTLVFSLPHLSKGKALVLIHRFFSASLVVFFILWLSSSGNSPSISEGSVVTSSTSKEDQQGDNNQVSSTSSEDWDNNGWFYMVVRVGFFLWVSLLNLIAISSTWARVIDVMDNESGSRLFGFIGAGATLGQLFGSLFATVMAWLGPFLLLFAALLMEFAAQSAIGINQDASHDSRLPEELSPIREAEPDQQSEANGLAACALKGCSPKSSTSTENPQHWAVLDGLQLILSSTYLFWYSFTKVEKASMYSVLPFGKRISYLSGPTSTLYAKATHTIYGSSSAWNFHSTSEKVSVIAATVTSSVGRRRLFALINSFIAVFILAGQLTLTGRILTVAGVTTAISAAPFVAFSNFVAIAVWPTWVAVGISETLRKWGFLLTLGRKTVKKVDESL
ncbi:hypothetical protein CJ030_MR3G002746 [Morella rubra]|uniref:TLC ATP/ADP transporter n=1 Tax=Morella rubra TaxID=262757 RepID=A0A6A1VXC3_9ROSI|nr:hypothetical protein CJ030_MR3G002746 [Morella rubra]